MDGYKPTGEIVKNGKVYKPASCVTYGYVIYQKYQTLTIHNGTCFDCIAKKIKIKCNCKQNEKK